MKGGKGEGGKGVGANVLGVIIHRKKNPVLKVLPRGIKEAIIQNANPPIAFLFADSFIIKWNT